MHGILQGDSGLIGCWLLVLSCECSDFYLAPSYISFSFWRMIRPPTQQGFFILLLAGTHKRHALPGFSFFVHVSMHRFAIAKGCTSPLMRRNPGCEALLDDIFFYLHGRTQCWPMPFCTFCSIVRHHHVLGTGAQALYIQGCLVHSRIA